MKKEKKCILKLLRLDFCSEESCKYLKKNSSCPDPVPAFSPEAPSFYGVHKHTKWYKVLKKEIEQKVVPILKLDDETEKEEARAM